MRTLRLAACDDLGDLGVCGEDFGMLPMPVDDPLDKGSDVEVAPPLQRRGDVDVAVCVSVW
jgi:hypothetical protein